MLCFSQYSNAQQIDPTTGNIVYTDANPPPGGYAAQGASWTGPFIGTYSNGGGTSGGDVPAWNPTTGTFMFGYNQGTVSYSTSIAAAFVNSGPGILVNGFTYSWNYYNQDMSRGTLSSNINITNSAGAVLHSYNYSMPQTTAGWTNMSGVQNFGAQYSPLSLGQLNLSFTGKDDRWWAGYYGPQIKDIDVRLKYSVDPCAANPLYASHCPGFNDIVTSGNLVPNPGGYVSWGQSLNQTFSIANALQHGGIGVKVHGFEWGYETFSGNPYYAGAFWTDWRDPLVRTNVNIKDSAGNSLYSVTRDYNDQEYWVGRNYSYMLPQSRNSLTLGNFEFSGQTWDYAGLGSMYARIQYTPDQCVMNPLFSTSCTGYAEAFFQQQCSANPLYNQSCPGYAQAYYNQQCSINTLYDSGCPGYAQAYYNQQCSLNALYDTGCPGYAAAYFTQQCSLNGLYDKLCPNYQSALLAQQCSINQLYSTQCPNYQQAKALKDVQDQLAAQTQQASQSSSTTSSSSSGSTSTNQVAQSSPTKTLADPTRTETVVTTDVGGVELTTTGQISVPTGETTATKESVKEAAKTEEKKAEEKKAEEQRSDPNRETERKRVDPRALAVAMSAVAATERTALATAEQAVILSQVSVGPSDGTGVTLGGGITFQSNVRSSSFQEDNKENKQEEKSSANTTGTQRGPSPTDNINLLAAPIQSSTETQQKAGPSVRNGGVVAGMEGGPDPAALARAPLDFNQYLNSQLKDAQFYQSREIYRGQRTVDNARAQRFLNGASDVLHQRMVEQQYQIGQ